jgi:hypothetical protein
MRFPIKVMGYHFEESVKIQEINSDTDIELLYTSDIEDVDMKIQERLQSARMSIMSRNNTRVRCQKYYSGYQRKSSKENIYRVVISAHAMFVSDT